MKSTEAILPRKLMQFWACASACVRAYEACNFVFHQNERIAQLQVRPFWKPSGSVDLQRTTPYDKQDCDLTCLKKKVFRLA